MFLVTVFRRQVVTRSPNTIATVGAIEGAIEGSTAPSAAWDEDQTRLAVQSKGAQGEADPENPKATTSGAAHPMSAATRTGERAGTALGTVDRRQFFRLAAIGAAAAAVAGALARWIPSTADVTASRSAVSAAGAHRCAAGR